MRLFIALPAMLDDYDSIKKGFDGIITGKWVEEENLHLTWIFLGEVTDEKAIIDKLKNVTPLENEIVINGLGYFEEPPRVFFAKPEEKVLYDKAREFKKANFDLYRFKPHITLCRIKAIYNYKAYSEMIRSYCEKTIGVIKPKIALYQSTLSYHGPHYQCRWEMDMTPEVRQDENFSIGRFFRQVFRVDEKSKK